MCQALPRLPHPLFPPLLIYFDFSSKKLKEEEKG